MKPKWLFERFSIDSDSERIVRAVKNQGMEAYEAGRFPYGEGQAYRDLFKWDDCVVFYGRLNFASQIQRETMWGNIGVFGNSSQFDCTVYYPALSKYLLAEEYVMFPYGDLFRKKQFLFKYFAIDGAVFLRPNSAGKSFTGQLIYEETFERDIDTLGCCVNIRDDELVVASPPRNVMSEWRFIVADKKVIASSYYRKDRLPYHRPNDDEKAAELAGEVAENTTYEPERVWCLDICNTAAGNYYVLEVGCVGCAGWYECDPEPVVEAISAVALNRWEEKHNVYYNDGISFNFPEQTIKVRNCDYRD